MYTNSNILSLSAEWLSFWSSPICSCYCIDIHWYEHTGLSCVVYVINALRDYKRTSVSCTASLLRRFFF